ncbi:phage tail protein [Marinobacter sp.]|uniref:phage tail protein n=1 Tax=Marinobacter sp. TaxID=50741 RepID=UPI000C957854|nr:phage tail protein [Marinobacter sp.]MAB51007.1 hypothetical protein [Marinobacter sp.]|tara:strand:- start:847 stop:1422 length:576 start_codon:yes stop_codon:yes gene_type:complete
MSSVFNVERFKSALTNGGLRPNQFAVQLSFPTYVGDAATAVQKSPFLVNIAELPGQIINPAIVLYRGREVKFAGDRVYAPWTITVLNDSQMSVRNAMEQWMNGMEDLQTKIGRLNPAEYQRNVDIFQLDRNGNVLKSYTLLDAFPVDISPVALDFGANDQISTFTVTWQYQSFATSGGGSNLGSILGAVFN